jgi:hypothetical protein
VELYLHSPIRLHSVVLNVWYTNRSFKHMDPSSDKTCDIDIFSLNLTYFITDALLKFCAVITHGKGEKRIKYFN